MRSDCPTCCLPVCIALRAKHHRRIREASLPSRCAGKSRLDAASWLPCHRDALRVGFVRRFAVTPPSLWAGQNLIRVFLRPRAPCPLPSGNRGVPVFSGPQEFPRPQARSSPPPCIGLRERTQPSLKGRVQTQMSMRKVSGVRSLHMSSLRHIAANRRQSYRYRSVRGSSWWTIVDLIYFIKRPLHCAARSFACFWPVAGLGIWTCECLALWFDASSTR
ncbi:hypothetical protein OKW49_008359 [Paraburkholderia youngii]